MRQLLGILYEVTKERLMWRSPTFFRDVASVVKTSVVLLWNSVQELVTKNSQASVNFMTVDSVAVFALLEC